MGLPRRRWAAFAPRAAPRLAPDSTPTGTETIAALQRTIVDADQRIKRVTRISN